MAEMKLGLQQRQDLKMTADLRQAIEMLQLSALDVQALVRQELADNPCLEVAQSDDAGRERQDNSEDGRAAEADGWADGADGGETAYETADEPIRETDFASQATTFEGGVDGTGAADRFFELDVSDGSFAGPVGQAVSTYGAGNDEDGGWESFTSKEITLAEHLVGQFDQLVTDAKLRVVGRFLIDGLDESGYLRPEVLANAATRLRVDAETVDDARALLQLLEPTGIGAADLSECLRLQLHARRQLDAAAEACLRHLDRVAARDWAFLAKQGKCTIDQVVTAVERLRACNPKPGLARFSAPGNQTAGRVDAVVPDVLVEQVDGAWQVTLNGAAFPKLLATPFSLNGLGGGRAAEQAKKYASENFGKAKWLIGALEQRAANILKVARAIVAAQEQFLAAGEEFLTPLTMRQVAERVGVHESTVSRVSRGKYLQTPGGVFEFTHFFASGINTTGGQVSVAAGSVQAMIARLVKAESPQKPLSDEQLVLALKQEGIEIARRTVAKYRGLLNIPGTSDRRVR